MPGGGRNQKVVLDSLILTRMKSIYMYTLHTGNNDRAPTMERLAHAPFPMQSCLGVY